MALELVAGPGQTRTRGWPHEGPLWAGRWVEEAQAEASGVAPFQEHRRDSVCQPPISHQHGAPSERAPDMARLTRLGWVPSAALCLDPGLWCGFCPVFEQLGLRAPHTWPQLWLPVSLMNSHRCFGASWTEHTWDQWGLLSADGCVCTCVPVLASSGPSCLNSHAVPTVYLSCVSCLCLTTFCFLVTLKIP